MIGSMIVCRFFIWGKETRAAWLFFPAQFLPLAIDFRLLLSLLQSPEPQELGIDGANFSDSLAVRLALFDQWHELVDQLGRNIVDVLDAAHAVGQSPERMAFVIGAPTARFATTPMTEHERSPEQAVGQAESTGQLISPTPKS
jgi:hypothetical protein